jgi:hypothetical protein
MKAFRGELSHGTKSYIKWTTSTSIYYNQKLAWAKIWKKDVSIVQCYKCWEMKPYSKECPNLPALPRENVNSYTWKFSVEEKCKVQVLIFYAS